ncbi:MAG TPA: uracil-DNA glycosylase [Gemmatimonadaceae bacterium]|nr:uracil-DNA glycosylase [Gemmatimonadaceae bacterium]
MDAKQRLRLYLEQRRDLGESELVLDSMSVDEVMKAIGAIGKGLSPSASGSGGWREALSAEAATPGIVKSPASKVAVATAVEVEIVGGDSLATIAAEVESCTLCPLYKTATRGVPGAGNPNADFVCIGEGPGANEDEQGLPFVGAAGQLLTKILAAVDLSRDDVFITNVVKHRPPGNRNPEPNEIEACTPYLIRQMDLIQPKVILALGTFAAQTLLNTKTPIGKLRGDVHRYRGIPVVVTYHPAALLRNPAWKRPTWEDVQLARRILDNATGP